MSTEELTAEESAALEAMQADIAPVDPPKAEESAADASQERSAEDVSKPAEGEPEFKSARTEEKPPEGYVPHGALHAEREKRKEADKRAEEFERRLAALEKPAEEEPQYVDPLVDPEGFRKYDEWRQKMIDQKFDQINQQSTQQSQQTQRLQQAAQAEQQFMEKTPDYMPTVKAMADARAKELYGMGMTGPEIQAQMAKDANAIFDAANAIGMNPAELAYMRAKGMGVKTVDPAPAQPTDAEKVVALAEAQKQTQGLGKSGGEQGGQLTAAQLADMSEEDLKNVSEADIRRAMGG